MAQFVTKLESEIAQQDLRSLLSLLVSARGRDLEAILGDLETLLGLDYVSSFTCETEGLPFYEATREDATSLRSQIRHAIIREYRTIEANHAIEVYRPLLDTVFAHLDPTTHCLPIFTTNYDLAIETLSNAQYPQYELVDGMDDSWMREREVFWNPREFDSFRFSRQARHIVLFKLHGSVNWMRVASSGTIVQALPMYDVVDSDEYQNVIIYPAGNKLATTEPYLTAYNYFAKCCEHAKLVIAIGYSFRDYDALTNLLRSRKVNESLRLLLLSPDSHDTLQSIPDEDTVIWTWPVYGYFGDPDWSSKYLDEIDHWLTSEIKPSG
jgi:hypothetical protein